MKYVFAKDLQAVYNVKGIILKQTDKIVLVKRGEIFTVWNPADGFIFCHTFYEQEAIETFDKYSKVS